MRILTVRQPWAWAIVHGGKDVENRARNIAGGYRGPVAIHAGLSIDTDYDRVKISAAAGEVARSKRRVGMRQVVSRIDQPDEPQFHVTERYGYRGAIIGIVDLVDVHAWNRDLVRGFHATPCSEWAENSGWHLALANPRPLTEPIPYRGALGLRALPEEVIAKINEHLGGGG